MWSENKNIGCEEVIRELLQKNGKDLDSLYARIPQAKQQLIENTTRAAQLGICGVPSIYDGQQIWWGQDRLYDFAESLCEAKTI